MQYGVDLCNLLLYYKAKKETTETQSNFDTPSAKIREAMKALSGHLHTLLPDAIMHFPEPLAAQVDKAKRIIDEFAGHESQQTGAQQMGAEQTGAEQMGAQQMGAEQTGAEQPTSASTSPPNSAADAPHTLSDNDAPGAGGGGMACKSGIRG